MDLQMRSDSLAKAKKLLNDKTNADKLHKAGKHTAYELMDMLFDSGTFVETNAYVRAYANELGTSNPAEYEGVVCGYGAVHGRLTFAYVQNAARMNGAFSKAAAAKITALCDMAIKNGAPVVSVFDSNGAKIEEGVDVLAGYGAVMKKTAALSGRVPQIAVVCGNTAGASATIASMADVRVMTEKAKFSVSPASVLADNGADKDTASAKSAYENGYVDVMCAKDEDAFESVKDILSFLPSNKLDNNVYTGVEDDPNRATPEVETLVANENYDAHDLIKSVADGARFTELGAGKANAVITAFMTVNGVVCGVAANNPAHNGGRLSAGALRKLSAFVNLCNSFGISVLNLVDTKGYSAKCEAEGGRMTEESAKTAKAYALASVPVITVYTGSAYGSALTVMGSKALGADLVLALDSAKLGVLDPAASVAMMWTEKLLGAKAPIEKRKALEEEWANVMSTPLMAAYSGQVDDIVPAAELRQRIASALEMLSMKKEFLDL